MAFIGKHENTLHKKAFDFYYSLEGERSLNKVARQFKKSKTAVFTWSKAFNWKSRIEQRDLELGKKLKETTDDLILNQRAAYRDEIKTHHNLLRSSLNKIIQRLKGKKGGHAFDIENLEDYERAVKIFEKLVKLDLLLLGEETDRLGVKTPRTFADWVKAEAESHE